MTHMNTDKQLNHREGILLLGHGSRREDARMMLLHLSRMIKERGHYAFTGCAFLQISHPTLREAVEELRNHGVKRIIIAPVFLFYGSHVQESIPEAVDLVVRSYPDMDIVLAKPIGIDERLADILLDRIGEVL